MIVKPFLRSFNAFVASSAIRDLLAKSYDTQATSPLRQAVQSRSGASLVENIILGLTRVL